MKVLGLDKRRPAVAQNADAQSISRRSRATSRVARRAAAELNAEHGQSMSQL